MIISRILFWVTLLFVPLGYAFAIPSWIEDVSNGIRSISLQVRDLSLFKRVSAPGLASFSNDEESEMDEWIQDSINMAKTALEMMKRYDRDQNVVATMRNFLGVDFSRNGQTYSPKNPDALQNFKDWLEEVIQYAEGGFARFDYQEAWLMRGDSFQQRKYLNDFANEANGDVMEREVNGVKRPIFINQVKDLRDEINKGNWLYWIPAIKGYLSLKAGDFVPGNPGVEPGTRCQKNLGFAGRIHVPGGTKKSMIVLCAPGPLHNGAYTSVFTYMSPKLIGDSPIQPGQVLDKHLSRSSVLLHEFMHAVRKDNSPDIAKTTPQCYQYLGKGAEKSPACLTGVAVAFHYLDQALKAGEEPYVFWSGLARTFSDSMKWHESLQNKS